MNLSKLSHSKLAALLLVTLHLVLIVIERIFEIFRMAIIVGDISSLIIVTVIFLVIDVGAWFLFASGLMLDLASGIKAICALAPFAGAALTFLLRFFPYHSRGYGLINIITPLMLLIVGIAVIFSTTNISPQKKSMGPLMGLVSLILVLLVFLIGISGYIKYTVDLFTNSFSFINLLAYLIWFVTTAVNYLKLAAISFYAFMPRFYFNK